MPTPAPAPPPPPAAASQQDPFNIPQRSRLDLRSPPSKQQQSSTSFAPQPLTPSDSLRQTPGMMGSTPSAAFDAFSPQTNQLGNTTSSSSSFLEPTSGAGSNSSSYNKLSTLDAPGAPQPLVVPSAGALESRAVEQSMVEIGRWALVSGFPPGDHSAPVQALQQFGQVCASLIVLFYLSELPLAIFLSTLPSLR